MPDLLSQIESALVDHINKQEHTRVDDLPGVMQAINVPGLSFVTFKDGEIDAIGVYGRLNATESRNIRPDTLFQAASISKSITALMCLRLVEADILDLDTDVNSYLKSWKVPPIETWQPEITLRQLLSHTAATTVHGFWGYQADKPVPTVPQILSGLQPANGGAVVVDGLPSHSLRYSGGGTMIAQVVMTDVMGKAFSDLAQEWVFAPLEMTDSKFMQPPLPEDQHRTAHAHFYTGHPVPGNWHIFPELAAAGLWTTPTDLSKFARAIQAAKRGAHATLSQKVVDWMLSPVMSNGEDQTGLGVFLEGDGDDVMFGHGGSNVGFRCIYSAYVDGRSGFALMTNGDQGSLFLQAMDDIFPKFYSGQDPQELGPEPQFDFNAYLGEYKNEDLRARITQDEQTLLLHWNGRNPLKLKSKSRDEFSIVGLKSTIKIERDDAGTISALNIHQSDTVQRLDAVARKN